MMIKKILAKASEYSDNGFTTHKAVMPNRDFMAIFMSKNLKLVNPTLIQYSQDKTNLSRLVLNGWVTLQNKAFAKYAGRLLLLPRVNPITNIFIGLFSQTQKSKGA